MTPLKCCYRWLVCAMLIVAVRTSGSVTAAPVADPQSYWAFRPPVQAALPSVKDAAWVRTPIDRFILGNLEKQGLRPSPQADRRTLIRRLSYDVIGLPPSQAEVQAFVVDESPDAYEKLVDRLLASPRYGERWGRYWLDLARYSDTKGYVYAREAREFAHAYNYRDWVIAALNDGMPYDRFLLLQLAADQATAADVVRLPDDLAAMGFLTVGRRFLGVVPDIVDDRIDVTMRTTLGLTVGCARCHDHKFDPIPTADYYSLYGVFVGSTEKVVCLDAHPEPTEAYKKYDKGLKERVDKLNATFETKKREMVGRLRAKAGDYLAVLPGLAKLPDDNFYTQLGPDDLNPVVLRQWQQYLFEHGKKFDPIWTPWTKLSAIPAGDFADRAPAVMQALLKDMEHPLNPRVASAFSAASLKSLSAVAQTYGKLFADVAADWAALKKKEPDARSLLDAADEAVRLALYGPDSPAHVPAGSIADTEWFFDEATRVALNQQQADIEKWRVNAAGAPRYGLILEDRPEQHNPRVFKRGNPNAKGEEITRHFLSAIAGKNPPAFAQGSGRLELARAIASRDNPLTARVMVNRIWMEHFGAGLVTTPSDFGARSETSVNQELLDWLAVQFMKEGWSIKAIHRLILCSATYRQSSFDNPKSAEIDPENRLLWRMNPKRLDYEAMRDGLLTTSGELNLAAGGKPTDVMGSRRSIYTKIDRQFVPGMARVFDFACPDLHIPQRLATTVPQQALFFMNASFVTARARTLAQRREIMAATDDAGKIQALYQCVYQRPATAGQLELGLKFIEAAQHAPASSATPALAEPLEPWAMYAHVLLMSDEFMFVD